MMQKTSNFQTTSKLSIGTDKSNYSSGAVMLALIPAVLLGINHNTSNIQPPRYRAFSPTYYSWADGEIQVFEQDKSIGLKDTGVQNEIKVFDGSNPNNMSYITNFDSQLIDRNSDFKSINEPKTKKITLKITHVEDDGFLNIK